MNSGYLLEKKWEDYGLWLVAEVGFKRKNYSLLMTKLHKIPFIFLINMDQNRAEDGLYFRKIYEKNTGKSTSIFKSLRRDCSVLEMLVALSIRIENEYIGDPKHPHPEYIFWEMIKNLMDQGEGISHCTDKNFDEKYVDFKVEMWMTRAFNKDGKGSIFPLKKTKKDQRKVEIWSQMNEYLSEKYEF